MSITIRNEQDNGSNTSAISFTTVSVVGDLVVVIQMDDFYTLAGLSTPGGTAVGGGWTLVDSYDGGSNGNHMKVWTGTVTTANGTVTVPFTHTDQERYAAIFVMPSAAFDVAAHATGTSSTSFVAPSVSASGSDDLIICAWCNTSGNTTINITSPGSMTAYTERDVATFITYRAASEQLTASGASGTRTASSNLAQPYLAATIAIKSVSGTTNKSGSDSASESESSSLSTSGSTADSATLAESSTIGQATGDAGTETESSALVVAEAVSDSAVLSDVSSLATVGDTTDDGALTDSSTVSAASGLVDSGELFESAMVTATIDADDGALVDDVSHLNPGRIPAAIHVDVNGPWKLAGATVTGAAIGVHVTGPARARVLSGPAAKPLPEATGPNVARVASGPNKHDKVTVSAPAIQSHVVSGPKLALVVTGPEV